MISNDPDTTPHRFDSVDPETIVRVFGMSEQALAAKSATDIKLLMRRRGCNLHEQHLVVMYITDFMSDITQIEDLIAHAEHIEHILERKNRLAQKHAENRNPAPPQKEIADNTKRKTPKTDSHNAHFEATDLGLAHTDLMRLVIQRYVGLGHFHPDDCERWQGLFCCAADPLGNTLPAKPLTFMGRNAARLTFIVQLLTGKLHYTLTPHNARHHSLPSGHYTLLPLLRVAGNDSSNAPVWPIIAHHTLSRRGKHYPADTLRNARNKPQNDLPDDLILELLELLRPTGALLHDGTPLGPQAALGRSRQQSLHTATQAPEEAEP